MFFSFLAIRQVLQCSFFIFHVFQCFSPYSISSLCVSHFARFSVFYHILGPTVCISHFPHFSGFLAIILVLQWVCLIFNVAQFSRHISGPPVCVSQFFTFFGCLAIFQVLTCPFLIFHLFQTSHHISTPTVCIFHFSSFSVFLTIFKVIECLCLIFQFFQFSRQVIQCTFLIFYVFHCFSTCSRSYSELFSFSMFFLFSLQIPGPTVCITHFPQFSFIFFLFFFLLLPSNLSPGILP